MGYLDNTTVTVDAILTNKGREVLAATGQLNITKFALADDEIDYDLWNPNHSLGSNYYGTVIENMPLVEALPDESQLLRYKLITLPKSVTGIPYIVLPANVFTFSTQASQPLTPKTQNSTDDDTAGYTAILADSTLFDIQGFIGTGTSAAATTATLSGISKTVTGTNFTISPLQVNSAASTTVTITGNATGVTTTITLSNQYLITRG